MRPGPAPSRKPPTSPFLFLFLLTCIPFVPVCRGWFAFADQDNPPTIHGTSLSVDLALPKQDELNNCTIAATSLHNLQLVISFLFQFLWNKFIYFISWSDLLWLHCSYLRHCLCCCMAASYPWFTWWIEFIRIVWSWCSSDVVLCI